MNNTGLKAANVEQINNVFTRFPQIVKVLLYGSRAMGNYKPSSDIDITLIGENINLALQQKLELELDDLLLPYKFDISIYAKISSPEFKNHIDRVGKVFYQKLK